MEDDDDDVFYGDLKKLHNLKPLNLDSPPTPNSHSKLRSMVVVKDPPSPTKTSDDEISVFPPCNHENLNPSNFNLGPKSHSPPPPQPSFPSPPLSFLSPDSYPSPSRAPPTAAAITPFTEWWALTVQIFRSGTATIGSYFRCDGRKSFGNLALAATVVLWWLFARAWRQRRRRRRTSVEHLMQIITEKDEKIMQLLSQIAKMNEVLLTRHKAVTSKLAN